MQLSIQACIIKIYKYYNSLAYDIAVKVILLLLFAKFLFIYWCFNLFYVLIFNNGQDNTNLMLNSSMITVIVI